MSTILKALRRLERDKATPAESRTLREAVTASGPEPARGADRPVWLVPGISLVAGIVVGAGVLLLWPDGDVEAAPDPVSVAAVPRPEASAPAPARAPAAPSRTREFPAELQEQAARAGLPSDAFASPVAVVDRPARQPRIPAPPPESEVPEPVILAEPDVPIALVQAQAAAEPDPWLVEPVSPGPEAVPPPLAPPATSLPEPPMPVVKEQGRTLPLAAPEAPEPAPAPLPDPVATAEPRSTALPAPPLPAPPAPTPAVAPPLPPVAVSVGLRVERTWWHPVADRREAEVETGETTFRVREGDRVGDATVLEIEPSAVVFERGEVEFRRVVGEDPSR